MSTTYTEISLRVVDEVVKTNSTLLLDTIDPVSSISNLKNGSYSVGTYNTLEHNSIILDGNCIVGDTSGIDMGAQTNVLSNSSGTFTANPTLTATMVSLFSSSGFTLTFGWDGISNQTITKWYNGTTLLATQTDDVTGYTHFIKRNVNNYNKIVFEFVGTEIPNRRIKLAEVDFGQVFVWGKSNIIEASYIEEVNLTSSEVTVNELNFKIRDLNSDFNMLNPAGIYVYLKQNQKMFVTEYIDGVPQPVCTSYLKDWESLTSVTARLKGADIVGTFDSVSYKNSAMWTNATISTILTSIMAAAGFTNYSIDSSISTTTLSGYIPICSVREALHQVCFAARMSLVSKRDGSIYFTRLPNSLADKTIGKSKKLGRDSKVKLKALVNSVSVAGCSFTAGTTQETLYSATLAAGTYEVKFDSPISGMTTNNITVISSSVNYVRFSVASTLSVYVNGYKYIKREELYVAEEAGLTNATRVQAKASLVNLVSPSNAQLIAQFLYNDKQLRIQQNFKLILSNEVAGDNVNVNTMLDAWKDGTITKLDIDLTGGFLADCEVIG